MKKSSDIVLIDAAVFACAGNVERRLRRKALQVTSLKY
jgi:hypothetical protein